MSRSRNLAPTHHSYQAVETAQVREVEVSVDISHTYIGDLVVSLVSPAGTTVPLHERTGSWTDNITTAYTPATKPAVQTLRGEPIQSEWRLKVADLAGLVKGKLNRWSLKISR